MEPQGRSCFALTQASFLNVVIIGGGCPQALPDLFPEVLWGWLSSSSSLEPGFPGFGAGA